MLTQERLKEVLSYNPSTGEFIWVQRISIRIMPGRMAGGKSCEGYIRISVDKRQYYLHRLAYLYMEGEFPQGEVDHINGNPSDNRWCNLRKATRQTNQQNLKGPQKNNSSGYLGVSYCRGRGKWAAQITIDGKQTPLGRYSTPEEAHQAYLAAKREHHEGCTI